MPTISLREVSEQNWRATLQLAVHPEQQRFVADYVPIAAIALAKAFVRPGGLSWVPYAIYADGEPVGLVELAYEQHSAARYWIYHFFIDHRQQSSGYGKAALAALIALVTAEHPRCRQINLTVHPDNHRARSLYTSAGFRPTGAEQNGEPVYMLQLPDACRAAE